MWVRGRKVCSMMGKSCSRHNDYHSDYHTLGILLPLLMSDVLLLVLYILT